MFLLNFFLFQLSSKGVSMSRDWADDIRKMHLHYGFKEKVDQFCGHTLIELLKFRIDFLNEELNELQDAKNAEDTVDALIDLIVVAIGTLDLFNIDSYKAWDEVLTANMNKTPGIKASRPNALGLPDLIKPADWKSPSHKDNIGDLKEIFPRV